MSRREALQQLIDRANTGIANRNRAVYEDHALRSEIAASIRHCESSSRLDRPAWQKIHSDLKNARDKLNEGQYDLSVKPKRTR